MRLCNGTKNHVAYCTNHYIISGKWSREMDSPIIGQNLRRSSLVLVVAERAEEKF